jgi:hypothetical protein
LQFWNIAITHWLEFWGRLMKTFFLACGLFLVLYGSALAQSVEETSFYIVHGFLPSESGNGKAHYAAKGPNNFSVDLSMTVTGGCKIVENRINTDIGKGPYNLGLRIFDLSKITGVTTQPNGQSIHLEVKGHEGLECSWTDDSPDTTMHPEKVACSSWFTQNFNPNKGNVFEQLEKYQKALSYYQASFCKGRAF